jgi:hypothetical protein
MTTEHSHDLFDEETYKLYDPNRKLTKEEERGNFINDFNNFNRAIIIFI